MRQYSDLKNGDGCAVVKRAEEERKEWTYSDMMFETCWTAED